MRRMRTFLCGVAAAVLALTLGARAQTPSTTIIIDGRIVTGTGADARPVRRARGDRRPLATSFTLGDGEARTLELKLKKRPDGR